MTTVLPVDEDQCRTPVILGRAANLFSGTALRVTSEPSDSGPPESLSFAYTVDANGFKHYNRNCF